MTSEGSFKRRCIIKKLDFENCVVTNIKTKAKRKKKLRARITREMEDFEKSPERDKSPADSTPPTSPVLSQRLHLGRGKKTSPVLIRKQSKGKRSRVLLNERKINFEFEEVDKLSQNSANVEINLPQNSPVFKVQSSKFEFVNVSHDRSRQKKDSDSKDSVLVNSDVFGRTETMETFVGKDNSNASNEKLRDCYQIEECTQESRQTVEILSVETVDMEFASSGNYSVESSDSNAETSEKSGSEKVNLQVSRWSKILKNCKDNTETVRRYYKKNSLLGRLEKLRRKQASEKLLWQHQKFGNPASNPYELSVIHFWNEGANFILKCQSLAPSDAEIAYLMVNSRWVPGIEKVKEGSLIHVYPPWQKLKFGESTVSILVNVICLEILEEIKNSTSEKVSYESLSTGQFESDQKLFVESLFSSSISGLLF